MRDVIVGFSPMLGSSAAYALGVPVLIVIGIFVAALVIVALAESIWELAAEHNDHWRRSNPGNSR